MSYLWMSSFKVGHFTPALNPDLLFQTFCSGVKKIHDFCV